MSDRQLYLVRDRKRSTQESKRLMAEIYARHAMRHARQVKVRIDRYGNVVVSVSMKRWTWITFGVMYVLEVNRIGQALREGLNNLCHTVSFKVG